MKPSIAITMGDMSGIGPEVVAKAVSSRKVTAICRPVIVGDRGVLEATAKKLEVKLPRALEFVELSALKASDVVAGRPKKVAAEVMVRSIETAVEMVITGKASAMVTAPINKSSARLAGFKFPGHTEFIAHLVGKAKNKKYSSVKYTPVMMLGGSSLKVVLVTIHEAIKKVPSLITEEAVLYTIKTADRAFKDYFGFKRPRIAVCGLNPHAGEGGLFGTEDNRIILPAVKRAKRARIDVTGPLPPDTVFYQAVRESAYDVVVVMYHDQGLIPLKLLHFEDGVNTTLGLPIIRTSPDHGTAYEIAGKGIANPKSMIAAITQATLMAKKR